MMRYLKILKYFNLHQLGLFIFVFIFYLANNPNLSFLSILIGISIASLSCFFNSNLTKDIEEHSDDKMIIKYFRFIHYVLWLFKEVFTAGLSVCKIMLRSKSYTSLISKIEIEQSSHMIQTIYGNSITLTPGTICIFIDKDVMLVHALDHQLSNAIGDDKIYSKVIDLFKYESANV